MQASKSRPVSRRYSPVRQLMRLSPVEGSFGQVQIILTGGVFLTALALSLGAEPWHLGLLAAIPHFTQVAQLVGAYLVEATGQRKLLAVLSAGISRGLWLLIPLLYMVPASQLVVGWFLAVVTVSSVFGLLAGNAWTTWMADLIPERLRGRYFGYRHAVLAGVTIGASLVGGYWLEWGSQRVGQPGALTAILGVATVTGLIGVGLLTRQQDIPRPKERVAPELRTLLLKPIRDVQFRKVLEFFLLWNAAIGFPAAFFNVHMIVQLEMSYLTIGVLQAINPLLGMFLFMRWGRILDVFQIRSVMLVTGSLIVLIPLIWLLPTRGNIGWLWVEAVISGLAWTGFNLSAYTYPMYLSPRIGRSYYLAYFSMIGSLGFVLASLAGGIVAQTLAGWEPVLFGRTFMAHHLLFVSSAGMRVLALMMLFRLREPKVKGTIALLTHIGGELWRTVGMRRPFPRWIRRIPPRTKPEMSQQST